MSVQYRNFKDIDIRDYDAVVVGAGFAGSVIAQQLAERLDDRVLMIEKRDRIAGCMYDELDENGIRVNLFGPHIFHTDDERVFSYVQRFTGWHDYHHSVMADWYSTYMPLPFNENSLEIAFGAQKAHSYIAKLEKTYGRGSLVTLGDLQAAQDEASKAVAEFVYENIYREYSRKQWGVEPDEIDPHIIGRMPVRLSRDNPYYTDAHQGEPDNGYTAMFERMLDDDRIEVCLGTEAESVFGMEFGGSGIDAPLSSVIIQDCRFLGPIVFTGPIDELFLSRFGRLPYRSVDFRFETYESEFALPCGTVNCTVTEDFTRVTECKRLTGQQSDVTTLVREYPCAYDNPKTQVPLYPILNEENRAQHRKYLKMVEGLSNFHIIGRLAEYRYYDMDQIVARALRAADGLCVD